MNLFYTLDDDNNIVLQLPSLDGKFSDAYLWAIWFEANRERKRVDLTRTKNGYHVSTVFTGMNLQLWDDGRAPLTFETMVFNDGELDMRRYATWDEAVAGHKEMVEKWEARTDYSSS